MEVCVDCVESAVNAELGGKQWKNGTQFTSANTWQIYVRWHGTSLTEYLEQQYLECGSLVEYRI